MEMETSFEEYLRFFWIFDPSVISREKRRNIKVMFKRKIFKLRRVDDRDKHWKSTLEK